MKIILSTLLFALALATTPSSAEIITLINTDSYRVPDGKVAEVLNIGSTGTTAQFRIDGSVTVDIVISNAGGNPSQLPFFVSSGRTINCTTGSVLTLRVSDSEVFEQGISVSFEPSTSVVIPTGSTGTFDVALQGSNDLVTWVDIQPGSFDGANPTYKFFRTRITQQ